MSDAQSNVVEFVSREQYEAQMAETLNAISARTTRLNIPQILDADGKNPISRKRVINAFLQTFELIGGVPRLAVWANENESDFYKLYARLLPSGTSSAFGEQSEHIVKHVLPRTQLDELPPSLDQERIDQEQSAEQERTK